MARSSLIAVLVAATEPRTRLRPVVPAVREYVLRIVHESMGMLVIDLAAPAAVVASALRATGPGPQLHIYHSVEAAISSVASAR
jgi:hypothetical protein